MKMKVSQNETWKLEITSYYKKGTKTTIKQNKTQIKHKADQVALTAPIKEIKKLQLESIITIG